MSRIKLATAAAVALFVSAPIASAAPFEFAGFYAGAHAGYSESSADFGAATAPPPPLNDNIQLLSRIFIGNNSGDLSDNGSMGGLQAGYNFINGNFMYGVETDISLTGASPNGPCPNAPGSNCEIDTGPMATLRARAGYTMDDWLVYVTGGGAASRFELDVDSVQGDKAGMLGWTVGAGAEYLVGDIVGVKLEYRYLQFGDFGGSEAVLQSPAGSDVDVNMHVIMGGINFHF